MTSRANLPNRLFGAFVLMVLSVCASCSSAVRVMPSQPQLATLGVLRPCRSPQDCNTMMSVLEAVAADFAVKEIYLIGNPRDKGGDLAVNPRTVPRGASPSLAFIMSRTSLLNADQVEELQVGFKQANLRVEPVEFSSSIPGVTVLENNVPMPGVAWLPRPDGHVLMTNRGVVSFCAPAFLEADNLAYVQFRFGPTPHGASGHYLLGQCSEGSWEVLWMEVFYRS